MRIGTIAIAILSVLAAVASAQAPQTSIWWKYDDMVLRNLWKGLMDMFLPTVFSMGCAYLPTGLKHPSVIPNITNL